MTQEYDITDSLDYSVTDNGSIISITPHTPAASEWIDDNVHTESWQWMGHSLHIDRRMAGELLYGMQEAGLTSNVTVEPC